MQTHGEWNCWQRQLACTQRGASVRARAGTGPAARDALGPAGRSHLGALLRHGVVFGVLVLAAASQDPGPLRYDEVEGRASALCRPAAAAAAPPLVLPEAVTAEAPRLGPNGHAVVVARPAAPHDDFHVLLQNLRGMAPAVCGSATCATSQRSPRSGMCTLPHLWHLRSLAPGSCSRIHIPCSRVCPGLLRPAQASLQRAERLGTPGRLSLHQPPPP